MQTEKIIQKLNQLSPDVGAVVTFTGVVRSEEGRLWGLEYEEYERMLAPVIDQLKKEAVANFHLFGAEIVKKMGRQPAGAQVFLVAVAARHRKEALEAQLKHRKELVTLQHKANAYDALRSQHDNVTTTHQTIHQGLRHLLALTKALAAELRQ